MFGKQKISEELKVIVKDMIKNCENTISLDQLNNDDNRPEPMAPKILLTVKG